MAECLHFTRLLRLLHMKRFGEKLRKLRTEQKITLSQLAQALNYTTHSYLSEIEYGRKMPTTAFTLKVARFFDVPTDILLKDELEIDKSSQQHLGEVNMSVPFVERPPTNQEVERLRLILSTYQDGSGMLDEGKLPGWRDFERSVAAAFNGQASESKHVYDVLLPVPETNGENFYGIDCKMRSTLSTVERRGYVTIEVSNASGEFWDAVKERGIIQNNYANHPREVAEAVLNCVESWHELESVSNGGKIIIDKSYYLVLQWNKRAGEFQLFQYPAMLPDVDSLEWMVNGRRLIGLDGEHTLIEWYGLSGGQLKYYPLKSNALWFSDKFKLEPLPDDIESSLGAKAATYFPNAWEKTL